MPDKRIDIIIGARDEAAATLRGIQNSIVGIGAAYLSWQGAKKVWEFTISNAIESEQIFQSLKGQVMALGYSYETVQGNIEDFTQAMLKNTRFSDEDAAKALQLAAIHMNNLADAENLVTAASKIASRFGMDLVGVTQSIALGYEGATRGLKQYGIIVDAADPKMVRWRDILEQVNKKYSLAVQEDMETYAGKIKNIGNNAEETGENLGNKLLEPLKDTYTFLDRLSSALKMPETEATLIDAIGAVAAAFTLNDQKVKDYEDDILYVWGLLKKPPKLDIEIPELPGGPVGPTAEQIEEEKKLVESAYSYMDKRSEEWYAHQMQLLDAEVAKWQEAGMKKEIIERAHLDKLLAIEREHNEGVIQEQAQTVDRWVATIASNPMIFYPEEKLEGDKARLAGLTNEVYLTANQIVSITGDMTARQLEYADEYYVRVSKAYSGAGTVIASQYAKAKSQGKEVTDTQIRMADGAADIIGNRFGQLGDRLVDAMFDTRTQFKDIFQGMAKDFIKLFIEEITSRIALAVIKWVSILAFFDKHENDMRAMRSGEDFARFFAMGVDSGFMQAGLENRMLQSAGFAPNMSSAVAPPITNINITLVNPIGDETFIRTKIAPILEGAASRGQSNLMVS